MKYLRPVFIALALCFIAGCSTSEERELVRFSRLKSGMTEVELKELLGAPKQVGAQGDFAVWTYPEGAVILQQGKVFSWELGDAKR